MLEGKKVQVRVGGDFEPIPSDKYTCQITDVKLVEQHKYQSSEMEEVLQYQFQILDDKPIVDQTGTVILDDDGNPKTTRGRLLFKRMSFNMGGAKSWLNKLSIAVLGKELSKSEKEAFDVESIVGRVIDVMTEQQPSSKDNSVIYTNIISFSRNLKPLPLISEESKAKPSVVKASVSVPATAPVEEETAEEFLTNLEKDSQPKVEVEEDEVAKAERLLAEAKAKKAQGQ